MSDITGLLDRWSKGDAQALEALVPLVYEELRRLAAHYLRQERAAHTLQPTALVHEAYLRLSGLREMPLRSRAHFFGAAAQVMRRVLVDHARRHRAKKRGRGEVRPLESEAGAETVIDLRDDLGALDDALVDLERIAPEKAKVVELRYFGGLSVEETGEYLQLSPATVKRYWSFSRAWLFRRLKAS
jgi:RNA polymerase sigma factor (TIGR02999 family)